MKRSHESITSDGDEGTSGNSSGAFVHRTRSSISNDVRISTRADLGTPGEALTNSGQKSLVIRFGLNKVGALTAEILRTEDHQNTGTSTAPFAHPYAVPVTLTKRQQLTTLTIRREGRAEVVLQRNSSIVQPVIDQLPTPLWDKRLRAFPPEIRNMIFEKMLRNTWKGRTPSLIKALRSSSRDQDMYFDAVYVFYKANCYMLNHNNGWSFSDMPGSVISRIRVLGVDIGYYEFKLQLLLLLTDNRYSKLVFHWQKLATSLRSFRVFRNLYFHTLYLTDTTQADSVNFTDRRRQIRNQNTARFLAEFVVWSLPKSNSGRKRKGLKHVVLSTELEFPLVRPLVQKMSSRIGRTPKLAEVSSTMNSVWFWDMVNRHDLKVPANMELFRV